MRFKVQRNVTIDNPLADEDVALFARMERDAISAREKEFFEVQRYKHINNLAVANDLIMSEDNNLDHIYIIRVNADEYIIGCADCPKAEVHTMNLYEALNINLKDVSLIDKDIILWDWLRQRDYQGVEYEHNFDDI